MGLQADGLKMTDEKDHPELQRFLDTLRGNYTDWQLERLDRSWTVQEKSTRKRRLEAIIQLSIELGKIREIDKFGTTFGAVVIEKLIEGDLKEARQYASDMNFEGEGEELRDRYVPIWAKFKEMALAAAQTDEGIQ